jgi:hypothetical protein
MFWQYQMARQRIRTGLTVLSLLLTVGVAVLWARSLVVADWLGHSSAIEVNGRYARREWDVLSGYGFIGITKGDRVPIDDASASWLRDLDRSSGVGWSFGPVDGFPPSWDGFVSGLSRFGFSSGFDKNGRAPKTWRSVEIPDWVLLLVVSLPAQLSLLRRVRARRALHRRGFPVPAG